MDKQINEDYAVPSDLFMLRISHEPRGEGEVEWRGKVQHVLTGEARYFRGWQALISQLELMLSDLERSSRLMEADSPEPEVVIASREIGGKGNERQ